MSACQISYFVGCTSDLHLHIEKQKQNKSKQKKKKEEDNQQTIKFFA